MKRTLSSTLAFAFTVTSLLSTTCLGHAQGLLFTDSFQTGQGDWTFFGNAWIEQRSGGNYIQYDGNMALNTPSPESNWSSGGYRTLAGTAGNEYRWSGHVHISSANAAGDNVYGLGIIQFLGASGGGDTPIYSVQTSNLRPAQDTWIDFSLTGVAPDGTERVRFLLSTITPETSGGGGALYYDLVTAEVTGVPEPTGLLALPVILVAVATHRIWRRRSL